PGEFRELIDNLSDATNESVALRSEAKRTEHFEKLLIYFVKLHDRYDGWIEITMLAAETARKAHKYDDALRYYEIALKDKKVSDTAERRTLVNGKIEAVRLEKDTQSRVAALTIRAPAKLIRRTSDRLDSQAIETLRAGFQALYKAPGSGNYAAIAGL